MLVAVLMILGSAVVSPALAQVRLSDVRDGFLTDFDRDVFFFAGRFQSERIWNTLQVTTNHYEDNYVFGAGFQRFFSDRWHWTGLRLGAEFGLAGRISFEDDPHSLETWYGYVIRWDGITIGETVHVALAVSTGFSMVTDLIGVERDRALSSPGNGPANLLFYLGPEISVSAVALPEWEFFLRLHHRSGLYGVIAELDAANAATAGIRHKF